MTIEAGRVLNERYRLIRPVGQGAQASVWVAEHLALGSQVAVKLIDPELAKKEDALERFRREATAAAQLRSAHVVQILDHGVDEKQPYIVMEMLDGEDLFERLEKRRRLTVKETSKIVTQVARALTRAHAAGIVHRDLKPENVFLVPNEDDEIAKVLDFGVAKVVDPAKRTMQRTGVGTLIGTPHYMSPEQVKGVSEVDFRADLWAVGVIAYQCVTGELPFDSEGVGDLLIKITIGDAPVPSKVCPGLPSTFDAWFAKACQREPDKRFESARDLADSLARAVGIAAPEAAPVSVPRPTSGVAGGRSGSFGSLSDARLSKPEVAPGAAKDESIEMSSEELEAATDVDQVADVLQKRPSARPPFDSTDVTFEEGDGLDPYAVARPSKRPPPRQVPAVTSGTTPTPGLIEALPAPPRVPQQQQRAAPAATAVPRSTVSGLASSGVSMMPPPELDGSRNRRAKTFFLFMFLAGAGAVAWFAAKPYLTPPVPIPAASATPSPEEPAPPQPSQAPFDPSATSASAVDPGKRVAPGGPTAAPRPGAPRPTKSGKKHTDGSIELPDPDREVPLKPGQAAPAAPQGPPPEPDLPPPAGD